MEFKYEITDCDVRPEQRENLTRFRERRAEWQRWLDEDKEHSIWKQITDMLWNDTVYRTVNEARGLAAKNPSPAVALNSAVQRFIDQSYVATQLLAIRRLSEKDKANRKDAITLPRLIDDMKENADLFTREMYVCYDGFPFDIESAQSRSFERVAAEERASGEAGVWLSDRTGPEAWAFARLLHLSFDRLVGVAKEQRTRDDKLDPKIFGQLKSKLSVCDGFYGVASKFIAHAADEQSRNTLTVRDQQITLNKIEACHRAICRVAAYINSRLLYISDRKLSPIPQYDHLKNLDKAWVDQSNLSVLRDYWKARSKKVDGWIRGDWIKEMKLPG